MNGDPRLPGGVVELAGLTWSQVAERVTDGSVLAVPLGSTEQHGPHLAMSTDTDIAVALCERLAAVRHDVFVAPPLSYGSSGEHAGFPGTLSIGQAALELVIVELCRSATETFPHIVLVNGHGGNADAAGRAVQLLHDESRDVHLHLPRWEGDAHAGRTETSIQLALDARRVDLDRCVSGDSRPLSEVLPILRDRGVGAVSASGVLGDPTGASSAEGSALLDHLAAALVRDVQDWRGSPQIAREVS